MPKPVVRPNSPLQILTANIDYDDFKGKLGIGRVHSGSIKRGQQVGVTRPGEPVKTSKVSELFVFDNLGRMAVEEASAGDIVMIAGITEIGIGDTVVDPANPIAMVRTHCLASITSQSINVGARQSSTHSSSEVLCTVLLIKCVLPTATTTSQIPIAVEEPTVRMTFGVNKSPLAGREGKFLTSRMIRDRLMKELDRNVALRVTETDSSDIYEVSGRGQLHLTVLIETMRREGFELLVGPPTVITRKENGKLMEPFEKVEVQVPDEYVGSVVDLLSRRKGEMLNMAPASETDNGFTNIEYVVPTRGMIGLRNQMLTVTRGTAVMDTIFDAYRSYAGDIEARDRGSLIAHEDGPVTSNGILGAQDRGSLFCSPKECSAVVLQELAECIHQRPGDLVVNVCKVKAVNNIRSATKSISEGIVPPIEIGLDQAVEYIQDDELVEVTPSIIRMLKNPDMGKRGGSKGLSTKRSSSSGNTVVLNHKSQCESWFWRVTATTARVRTLLRNLLV
eukprot:6359-Heterococcus_DN1.PRE.1